MTAESSGLLVRNARARRPQGGVGIAAHSSRDRTHGTPAGQLAHPAMAGGELFEGERWRDAERVFELGIARQLWRLERRQAHAPAEDGRAGQAGGAAGGGVALRRRAAGRTLAGGRSRRGWHGGVLRVGAPGTSAWPEVLDLRTMPEGASDES